MKKFALFDMDGVLYDSMPNHCVAYHDALLAYGINMTDHDVYISEGRKGVEQIKGVAEKQLCHKISDEEAAEMYQKKCDIFKTMKTQQIPGVYHLMKRMYDNGYQICIVTGSGQKSQLDKITKDFAPMITEDRIICAKDYTKGKPYPDPYLMGLERLGAKAEDAVVIENAPLGVRAGRAAGIFTIAVNTGPLDEQYFRDADCSLYVKTMAEAEAYLFAD